MNTFRRILVLLPFVSSLACAEELKKGNNAAAQPRTPSEQLRSFQLPEGFTMELVASEETGLPKPVSIAFDDEQLAPRALEKAYKAYREAGKLKESLSVLNRLQSKFPEYAREHGSA
jgi:predicted dithiol-disulfide oxidoreductase (DUF899 family)